MSHTLRSLAASRGLLRVALMVRPLRSLSTVPLISREPLISGDSANYAELMYEAWLKDPESVHASWNAYFRTGTFARAPEVSKEEGGGRTPQSQAAECIQANPSQVMQPIALPKPSEGMYYPDLRDLPDTQKMIMKNLAVHLFIRSFQVRGHRWAHIDPLDMHPTDLDPTKIFDLSLKFYGLEDSDLDTKFQVPSNSYIGGDETELHLREIIRRLEHIYCSHMGLEFMYINDYDQCNWLRRQFETPCITEISNDKKWTALKRIVRASLLERFLGKRWQSEKRFGLEGCEAVIPAIKTVIDEASAQGVDTFIVGMPHRGRVNILANVTRQQLEEIFCHFDPQMLPPEETSGDVKYHLGMVTKRMNRATGKEVSVTLVANPSHLEAVDPVVLGKTRASQFYRNDQSGDKVMAILLHGDAAFAAQGIVYETIDFSDLPAYTTHGTIHIVINNQIGFTTDPAFARSSPYCTDVARVVNAPIFHVNGDDINNVVYVSEVAAKWRQKFKKDVVIDVVGYRKHGHNEADDPSFTHPIMYQKIASQTPVMEKYAEELITGNVISRQTYENYLGKYQTILDDAYTASEKKSKEKLWLDYEWPEFKKNVTTLPLTGVSEEVIQLVSKKFSEVPSELNMHKGLVRILNNRRKMLDGRKADWALGEALAIGSLLLEGTHVRISGQDVERGTFSHRHHVLHDQKIARRQLVPLNNLSKDQAIYTICNSSLCEYGVLGFELGYSIQDPNALVIWEAQFGDFANNAQCIIDQYISSQEAKWSRQTGLVMFLPHGYEGSGPEHSSARVERFLQLCAERWHRVPPTTGLDKSFELSQLEHTNMIIANCTTAANHFHLLRRQLAFPFRKPLVVFTPKSLLRSTDAVSSLDDMLPGTSFKRVISEDEKSKVAHKVERVIFCTGKVYYNAAQKRDEVGMQDKIMINRVEQLCPFPYDVVIDQVRKYKNAEVCWLQEEPRNMGPFSHTGQALHAIVSELKGERNGPLDVRYIGRGNAAAAATGNRLRHARELEHLVQEVVEY